MGVKSTVTARFGKRLASARMVAGWESAEQFAHYLHIEPPRYRRYERGEAEPDFVVLVEMARALNTSLDWLLTGKGGTIGNMPPPAVGLGDQASMQ
jgi:transcriptional regulator with XRE-family HTH domain